MTNHKCRWCKSKMYPRVLTIGRRKDGPCGNEYGVTWTCGCGYSCWTRTTKRDYCTIQNKVNRDLAKLGSKP